MKRYSIIELIRGKKELFNDHILHLRQSTDSSDIMHYTWMIATDLEWLKQSLWRDYFDYDNITRNQFKLVSTYLENYKSYLWNTLYNISEDF